MNAVYRQKSRVARVRALILLLVGLPAMTAASGWQIQVVDPSGGGKHAGLQFDNTGNAHAVYWNEPLQEVKYAFWDRRLNKWFRMKVAERSSGYCSIALDSHQHPHIAYLDGQLKYTHWDGSTWKTEALQVGAKLIEYYTSIAVDPEDHPMITYYEVLSNSSPDYTLRLRSMKFNGRSWEVSTIDRSLGSGKFNSLAIGKEGVPQIAYANVHDETAGLRYARRNSSMWETSTLEGGLGHSHFMLSIKLALDGNGNPHIAYTDPVNSEVKYAILRGEKWQMEVVDILAGVGFPDRNGIVIDDDGQPYISYYDAGQGKLKVAHREADGWIAETVDDTFSGFTSAIQIDNEELVVIYYDTNSNSLKCARRPLQRAKLPAAGESAAGLKPVTR